MERAIPEHVHLRHPSSSLAFHAHGSLNDPCSKSLESIPNSLPSDGRCHSSSHHSSFHYPSSLATLAFFIRRAPRLSRLRTFTTRTRIHKTPRPLFSAPRAPPVRRYIHDSSSMLASTSTQTIPAFPAPPSLLPALSSTTSDNTAAASIGSGPIQELPKPTSSATKQTEAFNVGSYSPRMINFPASVYIPRIFAFLKALPALWTSTHPAPSQAPDPALPGGYADSSPDRSMLLFDMNRLDIPPPQRAMFFAVNKIVRNYMYGARYDPSHDYEHIQRVVNLTYTLYHAEKRAGRLPPSLDPTTMYLAALMHDVGETKYLEPGRTQEEVVTTLMLSAGASPALASAVATIAVNVSFTRETNAQDKGAIHTLIAKHPELAFVQDADRLDGLGAVGQARTFVFGGASEVRRKQSLHTGVQLHHRRFAEYVDLMKTEAGQAEARVRWGWMVWFRGVWGRETDVREVLETSRHG